MSIFAVAQRVILPAYYWSIAISDAFRVFGGMFAASIMAAEAEASRSGNRDRD